MLVLIVALIVVGAFAVIAIDKCVDSLPLAIVLQLLLLTATICIFVLLRWLGLVIANGTAAASTFWIYRVSKRRGAKKRTMIGCF
jgi:hypothetical protein